MSQSDSLLENAVQKVLDDSLRENSSNASGAGLEVRVTRTYDGKGLSGGRECHWCLDRCGENMTLNEAYNKGAFQRHPGCGCEILYSVGKRTLRQIDWRNNTWDDISRNKHLITQRQEQGLYSGGRKPDFYVGKNKKVLEAKYSDWIGDNRMEEYLKNADSDAVKGYIKTDYRPTSFIGDGSTADIRKFEIETGINCGRDGHDHSQKVEDLIRQINKIKLNNLSEKDRLFIEEQLKKLQAVQVI